MGGLFHLVQGGEDWAQSAQALPVVPHVTAHPSPASVPITILLYNGRLLCGCNVFICRILISIKFFLVFSFIFRLYCEVNDVFTGCS